MAKFMTVKTARKPKTTSGTKWFGVGKDAGYRTRRPRTTLKPRRSR